MATARHGRLTVQWLGFALAAAAIGSALYYWSPKFLEAIDLRGRDTIFQLRPPAAPSLEIAIIAVDEASVKNLGRWPWPRELQARLLREAKLAGAKVLALDIAYPHPESPRADRKLREAVAAGDTPVILGYFFRRDEDEYEYPDAGTHTLAQLASDRLATQGFIKHKKDGGVIKYKDAEVSLPAIRAAAAGAGFLNSLVDDDGLIRKMSLIARLGDDLYPSLPLRALSLYLEEPIGVKKDWRGYIDAILLGDRVIPTDASGMLTLNFYGEGKSIPTYSAVDVLERRLPPDALKDRLVYLGVTELGISDVRATPVDSYFPGVEFHGVVSSNILQERYLIRDWRTTLIDLALIVGAPLLLIYLLALTRKIMLGLAIMATLVGLVVATFYGLFTVYGYQIGFSYPIVSLLLAYLSAEAYRNLVMEKHSRFLQRAFSTYLSPLLVAEITRDPDKLKLGGEKRVITILFSDVRGFTTLSEQLTPEQLVTLLNRYLGPMSDIVLSEKGTLDKYIGDAIMAIYNAPVDVPDHATRACASALRMLDELAVLNTALRGEVGLEIDIGVGLHTGEAVVGNMGTALRFDYTAIGDAVNLASRLEGQNKTYGTHILVSDETRAAAGEGFLYRPIDLLRVKGKQRPVTIHELVALSDRAAPDQRQLTADFAAAVDLYRAARFAEAARLFEALTQRFPDDTPSKIYLNRCRQYLAAPPETGWDGVYTATSK